MKKLILSTSLLITTSVLFAQNYMTRTGRVDFDATSSSSPERVEAKNNEVACIVDGKTGDVRFQVLIKSFKFERELMQEHFNENYMESDKYPKSEFKGRITNLNAVDFNKDGTYNATVSGTLSVHGITKDITASGSVVVKGSTVVLKSKFTVVLKDYGISIPSVVADKLDKEAHIVVDCEPTRR